MKKTSNPRNKEDLEKMKLEIANEFDANVTDEEKKDGTMVKNLVQRAEEKISNLKDKNS